MSKRVVLQQKVSGIKLDKTQRKLPEDRVKNNMLINKNIQKFVNNLQCIHMVEIF